jgi:hypothetical protein
MVPLSAYTVKMGTQRLREQSAAETRRRELLSDFAQLAGYAGAEEPATVVVRGMRPLWKLRWENANKEIYWRLALNGLPTPARLHKPEVCGCGVHGLLGREHYVWECSVAVAVREALQHEVGDGNITRHQLWMAVAPEGCHQGVWRVVILAAVAAMREAWAAGRARLRATPPTAVAGHEFGETLGRRAVAYFWDRVADFCCLQRAPVWWREDCTAAGAFMRWDPAAECWAVYRREA